MRGGLTGHSLAWADRGELGHISLTFGPTSLYNGGSERSQALIVHGLRSSCVSLRDVEGLRFRFVARKAGLENHRMRRKTDWTVGASGPPGQEHRQF